MNYIPEFLCTAGNLAKPDAIVIDDYIPRSKHVMSRDSNGTIVSRYEDPMWDFTMFIGKGLRFYISRFISEVAPKERTQEYESDLKTIMFFILYYSRAKSMNTVSDLYRILKRQIKFSCKYNVSIKESLSDMRLLNDMVSSSDMDKFQIGRHLVDVNVLYSSLNCISKNVSGFEFYPTSEVLTNLRRLMKEYPYNLNQTPIIPSRILSSRIALCFDYIDNFLLYKDLFLALFKIRKYIINKNLENCESRKRAMGRTSNEFKLELTNTKYTEFSDFFGVVDYITLKGVIGKVRLAIIEMIHAFTGMRISECELIAMDGYRVEKIGHHEVSIIRSYTSKMSKDRGYFSDWVTSPEIKRAFDAAKALNHAILLMNHDLMPDQVIESSTPLFISADLRSNRIKNPIYNFPIAKIKLNGWDNHPINLDGNMIVQEEDIAEILATTPSLDIGSLKYGVELGKPFSFQTHMYRRSLAVFTARSGLVSLPTLKNQLKHIRVQTSAYYGKDASFAKNLILDKTGDKHYDSAVSSQRGFIKEFQNEADEAQVDMLLDNIITSDQVVFGGMGTQIQKQKIKGKLPSIFLDRKKTLNQVKQGRLRYVETPLGGCMATDICDRVAFSSIATCVTCSFSIFHDRSVPLLEKTKNDYAKRLVQFGSSTPYGKQLERDIRDIETVLQVREDLVQKTNEIGD